MLALPTELLITSDFIIGLVSFKEVDRTSIPLIIAKSHWLEFITAF